jgi:hypothetical protein
MKKLRFEDRALESGATIPWADRHAQRESADMRNE